MCEEEGGGCVELVPGGRDIEVTALNVYDYVRKYAQHRMLLSQEKALEVRVIILLNARLAWPFLNRLKKRTDTMLVQWIRFANCGFDPALHFDSLLEYIGIQMFYTLICIHVSLRIKKTILQ